MSSCTADERTAKGTSVGNIWESVSSIPSGRQRSPECCAAVALNASVVIHTLAGIGNPDSTNRPNAADLRPTKLAGSAESSLIIQFCMNIYYYLCSNKTIYTVDSYACFLSFNANLTTSSSVISRPES